MLRCVGLPMKSHADGERRRLTRLPAAKRLLQAALRRMRPHAFESKIDGFRPLRAALAAMSATVATAPFDVAHARFNMIEQQIRTWDVLDPKVLRLLGQVHRENFVPIVHAGLAFADAELPLGHGHAMLAPKLEARLLQELTLDGRESVYEVGTGSGYFAALLAHSAQQVTTAELHPDLLAAARKNLKAAGIGHVSFKEGDSASAPIGHEHYDAIVLTGSVPVVAQAFFDRLKPGGRLIAIEGGAKLQTAVRYDKSAAGNLSRTPLFECHATPLEKAPHVSKFSF